MYYSRNGGCLFGSIILIFVFIMLSFFTRLLFTPIGFALIGGVILYNWLKKEKQSGQSNEEPEINIEFENTNNSNVNNNELNDDEFSRDAEDVEYKTID